MNQWNYRILIGVASALAIAGFSACSNESSLPKEPQKKTDPLPLQQVEKKVSPSSETSGLLLRMQPKSGQEWTETFQMEMLITATPPVDDGTQAQLKKMVEALPEPKTDEEKKEMAKWQELMQQSSPQGPFMRVHMEGDSHVKVGAVQGETLELISTMKRIAAEVEGYKLSKTTLSSSPQQNSGTAMDYLLLLIDRPLTLTLNSQGGVQKVEGMKPIVDQALEKVQGDAELKQKVQALLESQQEQIASLQISLFPESAVNVGDSWQTTISYRASIPGSASTLVEIPLKVSLSKRENGVAYLTGEGTAQMPAPKMPEGVRVDAQALDVPISIRIQQSLDEATGIMLNSEVHVQSRSEIKSSTGVSQVFDTEVNVHQKAQLSR